MGLWGCIVNKSRSLERVVRFIPGLPRVIGVGLCFLVIFGGMSCTALMHPGASKMLKEAQKETGNDGVKTLVNLTTMMESTILTVKSSPTDQNNLDRLHDQFHALNDAFCNVTGVPETQPAYIKAVTLKKEMRTVFHRLWKFRERPPLRDVHLDLFSKRVEELRESLQSVTP